ncbi:MAG: YdcF family protein [Gammaproteobacteria bacterium]|nr:YdcF family protein [Gammaproteobacteria bacterium]
MASMLLSPLEYKYSYIRDLGSYSEVKNIVVLTNYAVDYPLIPLSSRVSSSSAYRILEAYRLYKSCENCKLFISGNETGARIMKELLIAIGAAESTVYEEGNSQHTYNSALYFRQQFNNEPFFLVTSAGHMPRAIGVFNKLGLNPIPAPTDFQLPKDFRHALVKPSPQHLYWSDLAVREYGGIAWYKMTNKM